MYLNGWIDFNKNNALTNTGEQIITNQTITSGTSGVIKTYTVTVPTGATLGDVGARFRISSISGAATSTASTGNGEVEDYVFTILAAKEVAGDETQIIALVNETRNMPKVKRVNPTMVLSLPLLGSELLVRTLQGDAINNDLITEMFFGKRTSLG